MTELYGVYRSRATRNLWLSLEAGQALTLVPVIQAYRLSDPMAADAPLNTRSPAFLALSPAGTIPLMKDGDLVLSESLAINLYLAEKWGGPLGPADAAERALMVQWALFALVQIEPDALGLTYVYSQNRAGTEAGQAEIAERRARLQRPLDVLNAHLTGRDWMMGDRFTVADINTAECVRYATAEPGLLEGWPAVRDWLARAQARPAFRTMWDRRLAEPA